MIDQEYVKSVGLWLNGLDMEMQQTRNMINFHTEEIHLHKSMLESSIQRLEHDQKRRDVAKAELNKYMADNDNDSGPEKQAVQS